MKHEFLAATTVIAAAAALAAPAGTAEAERGTCTLVMPCVNTLIDYLQGVGEPPPLGTVVGTACHIVISRPCA
jgi:hypothetical protein